MISIQNELFTIIATALRTAIGGIYVAGEYVRQPPSMPAVYIVEMDNAVDRMGRDSGGIENFADVMYQVDIFSNKAKGKKSEALDIADVVDAEFARLGFTRTYLTPVPNMDDGSIYRLTGRWTATVSKDKTIYRR